MMSFWTNYSYICRLAVDCFDFDAQTDISQKKFDIFSI